MTSLLADRRASVRRERIANWLALLALLAIGVVWPAARAVTAMEHAGGLLHPIADGDRELKAVRRQPAATPAGKLGRMGGPLS